MRYFPVFLDLQKKGCIVIGGGQVAERKVLNLLKAGASVTVVSPQLTEPLRRLKERGAIQWRSRSYRSGDLRNAYLAMAATDRGRVNERIFREAAALRIPVNVVDDPSHCTFIVPSVISRGEILLAISTGGKSPALTKALRKKLQKEIGPEYIGLLKILGAVRQEILPLGWGAKKNQKIFRRLLKDDLLQMIRKKNHVGIAALLRKVVGSEISSKPSGWKG